MYAEMMYSLPRFFAVMIENFLVIVMILIGKIIPPLTIKKFKTFLI